MKKGQIMKNKIHPITLKFIEDIKNKPTRMVKFLGYKFKIDRGVFPLDSVFSYSSKLTAKILYPKKTDIVLDIGTGTGVQAIIAAKRGAKKVVATDIDNKALKCANENVKLHRLEKIIEIRKSDLFGNISENEKFDIIISQLPFADVNYNELKHQLFDTEYKLHERLLKDGKKHLKPKGKLIIPSGEIANEKKLLYLITKYKYKIVNVKQEKCNGILWKVYFLTQ